MSPPQNQDSVNIFDLIDSICAEFRADWKAGKRPPIEEFLGKVPDNAREQLFRNLLPVEKRYRERAGDKPTPGDYVERFPDYRRVIGDAFNFSTSVSMEALQGTPGSSSAEFAPTVDMPAANRIGDYELIRELGRGGFGVVYEARQTKTGNRVALKTLPTGTDGQQVNADRLYRFRREFRRLSEINHPNLVGMQTLEVDGSQWFFTMDLIEGEDFLSYVRPGEQFDESRLRSCLPQLAKGVIELHRRGIIHRDLKPSNVLVTHDGRVTILDFGLAAELQKATDMTQTKSGAFSGTPPYAAPEQMFGERTEASDWYAFGTMLFEALAGQRPFHDQNPMALLRQKQEQDPPQLADRDKLPNDLAVLADGLLRREPGQRLAAEAVSERLGLDQLTRTSGSTKESHGSTGSVDEADAEFGGPEDDEIVLIGREEQLAQLEVAKDELFATRQPVVVLITGLSGEGKSSLAEKFLRPLRRGKEIVVLSGRCYDRESVPFKVIDSQIDSLVAFLRSRPESEVEAWLPNDIEMLARLFPVLRRVNSIERRTGIVNANLEERQVRNLAFAAFKDLLFAISQSTPIVMFIDDLQWGDADSAEVLAAMLNPPNSPALLLLGSFRSDEMDDSPFLREWREHLETTGNTVHVRNVAVEPLTEDQCFELVRARLGENYSEEMREQASLLFGDTKGNPYFLEQFLEGYDTATGELKPVPLSQIVNTRLGRCPAGAHELLEVIAVAGKAASVAEVAAVAELSASAISTLTHMRSERLIRLVGSHDNQTVDTYHDKIRETVVEGLNGTRQKSLHLSYAETIQRTIQEPSTNDAFENNDRIFDLAHHFHEAEDVRACCYLLAAGKASVNAFAMENAVDFFSKADQAIVDSLSAEERFELVYFRARALAGLDDTSKAIACFESAKNKATNPIATAKCYYALGECYWKQAEYETGLENMRLALKSLDERLPKSLAAKLLFGTFALSQFFVLSFWKTPKKRKLRDDDDRTMLLSQMYGLFTHMVLHKDVASVVFAASATCLCARRVESTNIRIEAYSGLASILAFSGINLVARRILRLADSEEPAGSRSQSGIEEYNRAIYLLSFADLVETDKLARLASERMERTRDWRRVMAHHAAWHADAWLGQYDNVLFHAKQEGEIAKSTSDEITMAYAQYGQAEALAFQGATQPALQLADAALETLTKHNATFVLLAQIQKGKVLLQMGRFDDARRLLGAAMAQLPKLRLYAITVCVFPCFVESVVKSQWHCQANLSKSDRRRAKYAAILGRLTARLFPGNLPYAYRISGRLLTAVHKRSRAQRYLDRALSEAQDLGARYEYARALIDKSMLDYPEAMADRQRGLGLLESLGCVLPDAEVQYLRIDGEAHHSRAAAARKKHEAELESGYATNTSAST